MDTALDRLLKGVDQFNAWRQKNQNKRAPDLRGAELSNTVLYEADLHLVDLRGAKLDMTDLRRADLTGAWLEGARAYHADLTGATLVQSLADLRTCICWETVEGLPRGLYADLSALGYKPTST